VAIARALINDPTILLADEPTGNLDTASSIEIMRLLSALNDAGRMIVIITHEDEIARFAKRIVRLRDGHIESDEVHRVPNGNRRMNLPRCANRPSRRAITVDIPQAPQAPLTAAWPMLKAI
jgi:ABC-type methionine transport system ATPase subunit